MTVRQNPFPVYSDHSNNIIGWKWGDETGMPSDKLYPSQVDALRDLLAYIDYINYQPRWYDHVLALLKRVWKDEHTGRPGQDRA